MIILIELIFGLLFLACFLTFFYVIFQLVVVVGLGIAAITFFQSGHYLFSAMAALLVIFAMGGPPK